MLYQLENSAPKADKHLKAENRIILLKLIDLFGIQSIKQSEEKKKSHANSLLIGEKIDRA